MPRRASGIEPLTAATVFDYRPAPGRVVAVAPAPSARGAALRIGGAMLLTMVPVTLIVPSIKELVADRFAAQSIWTHLFCAINLLGAILATPLIAAITDRTTRRRAILAGLALDAALLAAMGVAPSLAGLLTLRLFEGAAHMLAICGLMSAAADHAPPGQRGRFMGIVGAFMMFGTALGTRLGGIAWRLFPGATFEVAAAGALIAILYVVLFVANAPRHTDRPRLRDALALLRARSTIAVPYAYTFAERLCVGVTISSFVLFLASVHHLSPEIRSRLLALFLVPFALLIYPAGRLIDRVGPAAPLTFGSTAFALVFALYGFAPAPLLAPLMLASGLFAALMFAPTLSLCADLAPYDLRGAAFSGFNAAGSAGFVLGPLLGGAIVHMLESSAGPLTAYRAVFLSAAAVQLTVVLLTRRRLRRTR
ncbi:MAG: MFS transporter [Phycisphaerae bacterium]